MTAAFGVALPTLDVGSDYALAITIFLGNDVWKALFEDDNRDKDSWVPVFHCGNLEENQPIYGSITLLFPTISLLFTARHWWQMEDPKREGWFGRFKTLPLLLLQVWPQYRMIRVLYLGLVVKNPKWRQEQTELLRIVSGVEPFTESVPQIFWVLFLWVQTNQCVGPFKVLKNGDKTIDPLGMTSLVTSIISASYGLTNFLRVGPIKVIPKRPASGIGHLSFWLILSSTLFSLMAKVLVTAGIFLIIPFGATLQHSMFTLLVSLSPSLFIAVAAIWFTFGLRDSFKVVTKYPATILLPVFTPFMFGPQKSNCGNQELGKLKLNYGLTALNVVCTITGMVVASLTEVILVGASFGIFGVSRLVISLPLYIISMLFTITFTLTDLKSCCCCCCFSLGLHKPAREAKTAADLLDNQQSNQDIELATIGLGATGFD